MSEKLLNTLPEVFTSTSDTTVSVSRALGAGKLRKIGPRLYTQNLTESPESLVRRNLWQIVGDYMPGALIADRTAIENAPAADGSIFLIADRARDVELPGITLRPRAGYPPLPSDRPFIGGLYLSSTARAFLENVRPSRSRGGQTSRTLSRQELETRLDAYLRTGGEEALNHLRDDIKKIASKLDMKAEAKTLDEIIGTLLGTRDAELKSPSAKARAKGKPFDTARIELFQTLHSALRSHPPVIRPAKQRGEEGQSTLSFFEAYFSNFIEGTEFEVKEAADIIFKGVIPRGRPEDAHDILGTYRVVSDLADLNRLPAELEAFLTALRRRHRIIMESRLDKNPGQFKTSGNRAGSSVFVAPELVEGTLAQGFDIYRSLETPFARAVFMMFLVSEVHPFADGNGRIARVMMNAELIAGGEERIIIPTVYRNNYLAALKALSNTGRPEPLIRVLDYAQKWVASINWGNLKSTQTELEACNAFLDPGIADEEGVRLRMPQ